jgi:hypothetical protein
VRLQAVTLLIVTVPQAAVGAALAAQKAQCVRNPLLGQYFRRKLDDSTGDAQVNDINCYVQLSVSKVTMQ